MTMFEFAEKMFEFANMLRGSGLSVKLEFTNISEYGLAIFLLAMLEFATMLRGGGRSVKLEFINTSDYRLAIFL